MNQDHPRRFTVVEANRAIPRLERRLSTLREKIRELSGYAPSRSIDPRLVGLEGGRPVAVDYLAGIEEILAGSRSLEEDGMIVRDVQRGLVDFPAVVDGKYVYLCWVRGEKQVGFYHEPNAGFAGREPLPPEAE